MKKIMLALLCLSVLATTPACRKKEDKMRKEKTYKKKSAKAKKSTKKMNGKKIYDEMK